MGYASVPPAGAERRFRSRWKPASLLYVELDDCNGGVVLNISETGVAIHAAQTVLQDAVSSVRFKLPPSRDKIVARGQIAWKGQTRKQLGVRFVDLPEAVRLEIRKWIQADALPRLVPQKVRPFPLQRVRPVLTPVAPAPAGTDSIQTPARTEPLPTRYPISTAMAFALREASEADHAAPPAPSAPPLSRRNVHAEAGPNPVPAEVSPAPAAGPHASTAVSRPAGTSTASAHARPLVPTVLPLSKEHQGAAFETHGAHTGARDARAGWARRALLGAALTLVSFLFGLAAGGRDLTEAGSALSAQFVKAWDAAVAFSTTSQTAPAIGASAPTPVAAQPLAISALPSVPAKENAPGQKTQAAWKPPAQRTSPGPSAVPHAAAVQAGVARRSQDTSRSAGPSAARGEASVPFTRPDARSDSSPAPASALAAQLELPAATLTPAAAQPAVSAPIAEGVTGTVVVHSRLRTIHLPSELQFMNPPRGEGLQMGELLAGDPPAYPQEALRERTEGAVSVRALIGRDGTVISAEILKGPATLAAPSLAMIRGWRYEPTLLGGQPVEWEEDITLQFRLQNSTTTQK